MPRQNQLTIIGTGPGSTEQLTQAARTSIQEADILVGYAPYLEHLDELKSGKELLSSGMTKEIDRCRAAIELARQGRKVALVSGGEAGIYGMAGLVLELLENDRDTSLEVKVIPGISAFQAAASKLGAPLMHDTALISLSDLLTPWDAIRKRLAAAAESDFVIALYNPRSSRRTTQLLEAQQIISLSRPSKTPVGVVRNACRPDEQVMVTTLGNLADADVDMASVVIIGNSSTFVDSSGRMVTPRGYASKHEFHDSLDTSACSPAPGGTRTQISALMIVGTASDVGKSSIAAGICRLLKKRGLNVAPFKSQNMALNAAVTPEGGEIGRAQASQAQACMIPPHTDMNPILLKPSSDVGSQVIVQGHPVGNMDVRQYDRFKPQAFEKITESFHRLASKHDFIVIEGAGSIAEINLKDRDIANLKIAAMAGDCPAILVADIDRGGVFAQIAGSLALLEPWERALIKGVIINKFRGDISILEPGLDYLEKNCGLPVLGVLPWLPAIDLPAEDSLGLPAAVKELSIAPDKINIGVIRLPKISNFTDFDPLLREPDINLSYLDGSTPVDGLDLLIIPGSKSTAQDMQWLAATGLSSVIKEFSGMVIGICGGFQILGEKILDPYGVESTVRCINGLGLLPVSTSLMQHKSTRLVKGRPSSGAALLLPEWQTQIKGYEIHMGETTITGEAAPFAQLENLESNVSSQTWDDGAISNNGKVFGTYLHGLFDDQYLRNAILSQLRLSKGLPKPPVAVQKEDPYDRLATHLESHLDMSRLWSICGLK